MLESNMANLKCPSSLFLSIVGLRKYSFNRNNLNWKDLSHVSMDFEAKHY